LTVYYYVFYKQEQHAVTSLECAQRALRDISKKRHRKLVERQNGCHGDTLLKKRMRFT